MHRVTFAAIAESEPGTGAVSTNAAGIPSVICEPVSRKLRSASNSPSTQTLRVVARSTKSLLPDIFSRMKKETAIGNGSHFRRSFLCSMGSVLTPRQTRNPHRQACGPNRILLLICKRLCLKWLTVQSRALQIPLLDMETAMSSTFRTRVCPRPPEDAQTESFH